MNSVGESIGLLRTLNVENLKLNKKSQNFLLQNAQSADMTLSDWSLVEHHLNSQVAPQLLSILTLDYAEDQAGQSSTQEILPCSNA